MGKKHSNFLSKATGEIVSHHKGLVIITVIYFITFLLMLPLRDVAFEDDFAYILAVKDFLTNGALRTSEWAAPAMLIQIAWGGLFAKLFGYSIGILHFSNVVLFYFGLVAFYLTLKRLTLGEFRAVIFTLLLLSYPWVFDFTYSFMTDIFYLSLFLISSYFYIKAFQTNSPSAFLFGSLFAGLSYLQRQIGLIIPIAVATTYLFQFITTRKIPWKNLLLCLVPAGLIILLYNYWLGIVGLTYAQQKFFMEPLQKEFLPKLIPQNLKYAIGQTQQYYTLALIKRGLGLFDNTIAYLLPVFFIYKFQLHKTIFFIKSNFRYIALTALVISIAYIVDFVTGKTYTAHMTSIILRYDIFLSPNWGNLWPKMVWVSRVIWVIIIAVTVKEVFKTLFTKRKGRCPTIFRRVIKIYLISYLGIFLIFLQNNFPFMFSSRRITLALNSFSSSPDFLDNIGNLISLKHIIIGLKTAWFFLAVTLSTLILSTYIFLVNKFKPLSKTSQPLMFLSLVLIANLLLICFFNYYYYEEYVIQFIPIFFVWIAYLLRKVSISQFRAVMIVLVMILFSVSSTRQRYQTEGLSWQLGVQMVEKGVDPNFISVNWPWRPYWYFEREIPKLMEEYKDNKYKMPPEKFAGWPRTLDNPGTYYSSSPVTFHPTKRPDVVLESEKFWMFTKEFPGIKWMEVNMGKTER